MHSVAHCNFPFLHRFASFKNFRSRPENAQNEFDILWENIQEYQENRNWILLKYAHNYCSSFCNTFMFCLFPITGLDKPAWFMTEVSWKSHLNVTLRWNKHCTTCWFLKLIRANGFCVCHASLVLVLSFCLEILRGNTFCHAHFNFFTVGTQHKTSNFLLGSPTLQIIIYATVCEKPLRIKSLSAEMERILNNRDKKAATWLWSPIWNTLAYLNRKPRSLKDLIDIIAVSHFGSRIEKDY